MRSLPLVMSVAIAGCAPGGLDEQGPVGTTDARFAEDLAALPGVTIVEVLEQDGYRDYDILFTQPADHDSPEGQTFQQRVIISHRTVDAPVVLVATGYDIFESGFLYEPTEILGANQIVVEHRFFAGSRPSPADWSHLDIRQAAADHHRLIEALRNLYTTAWVSTGHSKGGMTSLFHRRFYPDDVDGTVAYVAPINHSVGDPRYAQFMAGIGPPGCRSSLVRFERELLARPRRQEVVALVQQRNAALGLPLPAAPEAELALGMAVVGFEWTFWQYLPANEYCPFPDVAGAESVDLLDFVEALSPAIVGESSDLDPFYPYYYQCATELGFPGTDASEVLDLLPPGADQLDLQALPDLPFRPEVMQDVLAWVASSGSNIILVYGGYDPWTGGAVPLGAATDSESFLAPTANHDAMGASLTPVEQARFIQRLESWVGYEPARRSARVIPSRPLPPELRLPRRQWVRALSR